MRRDRYTDRRTKAVGIFGICAYPGCRRQKAVKPDGVHRYSNCAKHRKQFQGYPRAKERIMLNSVKEILTKVEARAKNVPWLKVLAVAHFAEREIESGKKVDEIVEDVVAKLASGGFSS